MIRNFVIRKFVIGIFVIRNFVIRNFVPVPQYSNADLIFPSRGGYYLTRRLPVEVKGGDAVSINI